MSGKQDKKLRRQASKITEAIQFRGQDILNGIKETWTLEERKVLTDWLMDDEAGRWGE